MEKVMLDIMYELPISNEVAKVRITEKCLEGASQYTYREMKK